ncbi:MAG: hypothetical protein EB032_09190 [Betaproteobacteria bacterium]|nr:hypothetical protein [Betaproteobacteria bacterium]NDD02283.1 hypothetical protein [Betaproteobacteria bacterium]NDF79251.1 hypothetical protein [Betaproteobacteria bacterium]
MNRSREEYPEFRASAGSVPVERSFSADNEAMPMTLQAPVDHELVIQKNRFLARVQLICTGHSQVSVIDMATDPERFGARQTGLG